MFCVASAMVLASAGVVWATGDGLGVGSTYYSPGCVDSYENGRDACGIGRKLEQRKPETPVWIDPLGEENPRIPADPITLQPLPTTTAAPVTTTTGLTIPHGVTHYSTCAQIPGDRQAILYSRERIVVSAAWVEAQNWTNNTPPAETVVPVGQLTRVVYMHSSTSAVEWHTGETIAMDRATLAATDPPAATVTDGYAWDFVAQYEAAGCA